MGYGLWVMGYLFQILIAAWRQNLFNLKQQYPKLISLVISSPVLNDVELLLRSNA